MTESLSRPSAEAPPTPQSPAATATTASATADGEFCRTMLPRVSRTFALNIRLLRGSMGDAVRIGYLLCRIADTIEDAWPGERYEVEQRFMQLIAALNGDTRMAEELAAGATSLRGRASAPHVELVARTPEVLRAFSALPMADRLDVGEAVLVMALGMHRYAGRAAERRANASATGMGGEGALLVPYLDNDAELSDYCWIVAGCVGVMLTRLFDRRAPATGADSQRLVLAPVVGEGLQLTNILLDWPTDIRGGRCHVPASWLAEFGLSPIDLVDGGRPEVRVLAQRLEDRARAALARVPDYLATIPSRHVRYRMFCLWPALWAAASLRHARRDPTFPWGAERPRLPKSELWGTAVAALGRGHSAPGVDGLFRGVGVTR